jgi:hypothetical protein
MGEGEENNGSRTKHEEWCNDRIPGCDVFFCGRFTVEQICRFCEGIMQQRLFFVSEDYIWEWIIFTKWQMQEIQI